MCLFCRKYQEKKDVVFENDTVYVLNDAFPVTKGHVLIIPKRHLTDYFAISEKEVLDIDKAIKVMKSRLDREYHPNGYNVGINNGEAAGQTIMHVHVHLIPRYLGDCENPRGGVRGVIPGKQSY